MVSGGSPGYAQQAIWRGSGLNAFQQSKLAAGRHHVLAAGQADKGRKSLARQDALESLDGL